MIKILQMLRNSVRGGKQISTNFIDRPVAVHRFLPWFLPSLVIIALFVIVPLIFVVRDSTNAALFYDHPKYSASEPRYEFGGRAFSYVVGDATFRKAVVNSLLYITLTTPITIALAIIIAALIVSFMNKRLRSALQTFFFIPYVTSIVAITLVVTNIFGDEMAIKDQKTLDNGHGGLINAIVSALGGNTRIFLKQPSVSDSMSSLATLTVVAIFGSWRTLAFNILILTTAMLSVNKELYRASSIDGAGRMKQFLKITLPQVRPTILYLTTVAIIQGIKIFPLPAYAGDSSTAIEYFPTLMLYVIHKTNITQYGVAAVASIFILLISLAISLLIRAPLYATVIKTWSLKTRSYWHKVQLWR